MDKDQLKQFLENAQLEEDFKVLLFDLIDKTDVIDQAFLNSIADLLDLQAKFYEHNADLLSEEAEEYSLLADEFTAINEEANADTMQSMLESQTTYLNELSNKMNELKTKQEINTLNQAREQLSQVSTGTNTPLTHTAPQAIPSSPMQSSPQFPPVNQTNTPQAPSETQQV